MKPNWKPGHPTEDGVYWISVAPKHREPTHWEQPKSPSVWLVWVNDGFCQALTQGMKSYPLSAVPPCDAIMKHAPYFPPKREPQPLTPEQIKAQAKRERKAAKRKERMGTRAASKHRCLCGRFIGTDGCGKCLHYVCARCKKVADHTNGTTDHSELCDACWSAEFADTQEAMAS